MKLNDFLGSENISMGTFAKTVGTTTATISRVADGTVVPRRGLMERIYVVTQGLVTPNDLVGIAVDDHCAQCANGNCQQHKLNEGDTL
jgi:hypothetical protein